MALSLKSEGGMAIRWRVTLLALLLAASGIMGMRGQVVSDSTLIYFHQSKTDLLPGYKGNGERMERMLERLNAWTTGDSAEYRLKEVRVEGEASPEGPAGLNRTLSEKRAERIFDYFASRINLPDSLTRFRMTGRDWQGLYELVADDNAVPYKDEVMALLNRSERLGGTLTGNELLGCLKALRGGEPYSYMYSHLFPTLRASRIYVEYERMLAEEPEGEPAEEPITEITEITDTPVIEEPVVTPITENSRRPFYMALKSNMLYDALAVPSISAEFYIGRNWSVAGNWMYGWWDNDHKHRYWRAYGGDIAIRKWFGSKAHEKPLTGHHIGVYGGVVTYDFEFGGTGYMGGKPGHTLWDRCMKTCGVEYGYSLPIGRRLNIDFTFGVGYMGGRYVKYRPSHSGHSYVWESTHNLNWFGPTKAEISITWLIGHDNYNRKK